MKIAIEGVKLHAYHGVYPEERKKGTQFVVDVYIDTVGGITGKSDDLSHTIDYSEVYELILKVMSKPVNLLETLVETIGKGILENHPDAAKVKVRVSKEKPLAMDKCLRAYVEASFAQN
jgi:dihydroneopterin aldolase